MSGGRSSALRKVVRLTAALDPVAATDRELLRRFARENDQGAFEALVNRHTAMVFGVCRRALLNVQDAEDACQASFLVLANRARDGRWQESVANWLYATARKVARNARVTAERRARREIGAAVPEAVEPVDRMTGRDLLAALDAALDRLPSSYREPIVLCFLEGLTRDEAASRLGIPLATLHTRIDRARKRLHDALTKAGCTLGAGLLALAATSPAGAVPPRLVPSVLACACGTVPDGVRELAEGIAVNGLHRKLVLALAAVVVLAIGTGLGALDTNAPAQPPAAAPQRAETAPPPKDAPAKPVPKEAILTGRVLDPDGKPLAGAKLFADRLDKLVEVGTSGADGKFTVTVPAGLATTLVARADGVGLDFRLIPPNRLGEEIELRTVQDHPVRGRILDTQGKPVAGATVEALNLDVFTDNSLDVFLAQVKQSGLRQIRGKPLSKSLSQEAGCLPPATTDKDGRFVIEGVGAERIVMLHVSGAGVAETRLVVVNRKDFDPKPYNELKPTRIGGGGGGLPGSGPPISAGGPVFHGPDGSVVVEAEKRVRGTVTDAGTGTPLAGVTVMLESGNSSLLRGGLRPPPHLSAVTDAAGKYEIRGVRKSASYTVAVDSDLVTRYFMTRVQANDTAGHEPVAVDLKLKKGVFVTGKVFDAGTKKTVPGFASFAILPDNKFVKEYPEFDTSPGGAIYPDTNRVVSTDDNGVFRIVTIPGPILFMGGVTGSRHMENTPAAKEALKRYETAASDPNYPQYFDLKANARFPVYVGYNGRSYGTYPRQFCKVLEIKADAETVEQDVLLVPVK